MKSKTQNAKCKVYNQTGFTLVESLVAITILIIGVLGPMTAATRGITDGLYAQNQLIATHLGQEGLELLSTQIANNNMPPVDKNGDLTTDINDLLYDLEACKDLDCAVAITSAGDFSFSSCASSSNCQIAYSPVTGFYEKYDSSNASNFVGPIFTRTLKVDTLIVGGSGVPSEALLRSKVEWTNKSTSPQQKVELVRYAFHAIL